MSTISSSDSANLSLIQTLITQNRTAYNRLTEEISSGTEYLMRSDDPATTNRASLVDLDEAQQTQWSTNIKYATNWETSTYSYLDDISDQFSSAVTLATQANSTITESSGWTSISSSLSNVVDSILSDSNASYLGTSLFAGTGTSTDSSTNTFTKGNASVSGFYTITYNGNDTQRTIKTSSSTAASALTTYGTTGNSLFSGINYTYTDTDSSGNTITYTTPSGTSYNSLEAISDLQSITNIGTASLSSDQLSYLQDKYKMVDSSTGTTDTPTITTIVSRIMGVISKGSTQISNSLATNSASSSRMISLKTTVSNAVSTDETQYSDLVGIDTAKAATDLSTMKTVLQASMTLAGNISSMSLVNYI